MAKGKSGGAKTAAANVVQRAVAMAVKKVSRQQLTRATAKTMQKKMAVRPKVQLKVGRVAENQMVVIAAAAAVAAIRRRVANAARRRRVVRVATQQKLQAAGILVRSRTRLPS